MFVGVGKESARATPRSSNPASGRPEARNVLQIEADAARLQLVIPPGQRQQGFLLALGKVPRQVLVDADGRTGEHQAEDAARRRWCRLM